MEVKFMRRIGMLLVLFVLMIRPAEAQPDWLDDINLPPGFEISIYAENVPGARSLTIGDQGIVFVGTRGEGNVYALIDANGDHYAESVRYIASGWNSPNGVAFHNGDLYVAELNRIRRFIDIENTLDNPTWETITQDFPSETHHAWKFIAFGPDDMLYVPVGVPCDLCRVNENRFGIIWQMDADGGNRQVYARGIRNTVGFDFHPETGELWFTDNGTDNLGDDIPADELNYAPFSGLHFGFPYCHGGDIVDRSFGTAESCQIYEPPAQQLPAHVAALGMRFYTDEMFPEEYINQIFIAEHGSRSRSEAIGYRISLVRIDEETGETSYEIFADGWLYGTSHTQITGRPVDVLVMPDGALLVSDDYADVVYRISYVGN